MVSDEAFSRMLSRLKTIEHDLERTKTTEVPVAAGGGGTSVPLPTNRGDMLVADATPAWAIFPLGAATGAVYTRNATDPVWSNILTIDLTNGRAGINDLTPDGTFEIDGIEDIPQLIIVADAAQSNTNPLILANKSIGTELFRIHSDHASNLFAGYQSGNVNDITGIGSEGLGNTFFGSSVGALNTTGYMNVGVGYHALAANTNGFMNTAVGMDALVNNVADGDYNTAVGKSSMAFNTVGYINTSIGIESLHDNITGNSNTGCGANTLQYNTTGYQNAALGAYALLNVLPTSMAIWAFADSAVDPGVKTRVLSPGHGLIDGITIEVSGTVNYNGIYVISNTNPPDFFDITIVFVINEDYGWWAFPDEGSYNTAGGAYAGASITIGYLNTFVGFQAGYDASQKIDAINSMALGYGAYTTADNQIVLGNSSVTDVLIHGATVIEGGGLTVNETGIDADSRMEGDTLAYMLFLDASAATENIALLTTAAPNWQTMDRGVFLGDASTVPTGDPTSGVFIYSEAGAAKCRGGGGTVTTFGPSDPHCPICDSDYMLEWENEKYGYLSVCINCLTQELGEKPWILHHKRGGNGS